MAREYAQINVSIWQDADFRALPALAKQVYLDLWLHPTLSYCGVADWRVGRFAGLHPDLTVDQVRTIADSLEARLFVVRDEETEEILVRSWVRFDGLLKQPRLSVSYAKAFAATTSSEIRGVIVHEAQRLRERDPGLVGWRNQHVQNLLEQPAIDPRSRDLPTDPFATELPKVWLPGEPPFGPNVGQRLASVSLPPTTSTSTSTYLPAESTDTDTTPQPASSDDSDDFKEFWAAYPKKVDKGAARRAWKSAIKKAPVERITSAARSYANQPDLKRDGGKFIKNPSTWLNAEAWDNETSQDGEPVKLTAAQRDRIQNPWKYQ